MSTEISFATELESSSEMWIIVYNYNRSTKPFYDGKNDLSIYKEVFNFFEDFAFWTLLVIRNGWPSRNSLKALLYQAIQSFSLWL